MTIYELALIAHSWVRWLIVVAAILVIARSAFAWRGGHDWTSIDERIHAALVGFADIQLALGLCLYVFWSPYSDAFMRAPAAAMKEHSLRFFGLEHPTMMLLAVVLLHLGRVRSRKATTARAQHRSVTLWTLAALIVVFSSIPWPGLRHGRPLLRAATTPTVAPVAPY